MVAAARREAPGSTRLVDPVRKPYPSAHLQLEVRKRSLVRRDHRTREGRKRRTEKPRRARASYSRMRNPTSTAGATLPSAD
eukprot:365431-Chlamydomonas_euryale.AAC.20